MPNLKKIKQRIKAIQTTSQITAAMKVVALSRLKHQHQDFLKTSAYSLEITRMVRRLLRSLTTKNQENVHQIPIPHVFKGVENEKIIELMVITSDEGLSGSSNVNVIEKTNQVIKYLKEANKEIHISAYGTKGGELLKNLYPDIPITIIKRKENLRDKSYYEARALTGSLLERFEKKEFDTCLFIYNSFKSILIQKPIIQQVIPSLIYATENPWDFLNNLNPDYRQTDLTGQESIKVAHSPFFKAFGAAGITKVSNEIMQNLAHEPTRAPFLYDYMPSDRELLNYAIAPYFESYINRVLLETALADNAARLTTMDNATKEAEKMQNKLRQMIQHIRQQKITLELIEKSAAFLENNQ